MKTLIKHFTLIIFFAGISLSSFGQVPDGFNYQAVVRDAGGALVTNSTITVKLEIHESTPTGTVTYDETHFLNTNEYGLFSLVVGTGTAGTGNFSTIDWANNDLFLEVSVNTGSGLTEMGTTQLMSVPYSFSANTAEKATNMELDELTNVSSTSPTNGQVLKWNGTQWTPAADNAGSSSTSVWNQSGTNISYTDGNIGLGTATPSHPLHIIESGAPNTISIEVGTPNNGKDLLEMIVDPATTANAQFIELQRGSSIVAAINTDGSAKFKSVEFEDGTVQETAAIGPIAFGFIQNAAITSGSGNYTVLWNSTYNRYEITIAGESYFWSNYTTVVTPAGSVVKSVTTGSIGGKLVVQLFNASGSPIQNYFQFVTYK